MFPGFGPVPQAPANLQWNHPPGFVVFNQPVMQVPMMPPPFQQASPVQQLYLPQMPHQFAPVHQSYVAPPVHFMPYQPQHHPVTYIQHQHVPQANAPIHIDTDHQPQVSPQGQPLVSPQGQPEFQNHPPVIMGNVPLFRNVIQSHPQVAPMIPDPNMYQPNVQVMPEQNLPNGASPVQPLGSPMAPVQPQVNPPYVPAPIPTNDQNVLENHNLPQHVIDNVRSRYNPEFIMQHELVHPVYPHNPQKQTDFAKQNQVELRVMCIDSEGNQRHLFNWCTYPRAPRDPVFFWTTFVNSRYPSMLTGGENVWVCRGGKNLTPTAGMPLFDNDIICFSFKRYAL